MKRIDLPFNDVYRADATAGSADFDKPAPTHELLTRELATRELATHGHEYKISQLNSRIKFGRCREPVIDSNVQRRRGEVKIVALFPSPPPPPHPAVVSHV